MKTFTIENETNNIVAHTTKREAAAAPNAESFSSDADLSTLAANWPASRLIEIWNSIPGNAPVARFKDRNSAVTRIWKAIQSLGDSLPTEVATEPEAPANEAPQEAPAAEPTRTEASPKVEPGDEAPTSESEHVQAETPASEPERNVGEHAPDVAPQAVQATNRATRQKKTPTGEQTPKAPREESKTSRVIERLKREGGTTLEEIMTTMDWQKHTTRAMLSAGGSLTKKHGLNVASEKVGEKRVYSIKA